MVELMMSFERKNLGADVLLGLEGVVCSKLENSRWRGSDTERRDKIVKPW